LGRSLDHGWCLPTWRLGQRGTGAACPQRVSRWSRKKEQWLAATLELALLGVARGGRSSGRCSYSRGRSLFGYVRWCGVEERNWRQSEGTMGKRKLPSARALVCEEDGNDVLCMLTFKTPSRWTRLVGVQRPSG
jgi:hypothetical protein